MIKSVHKKTILYYQAYHLKDNKVTESKHHLPRQ